MLTVPVRQLGEADRRAVERVLDRDPYGATTVAEVITQRGLPRWRGDAVYGYGTGRDLESVCWSGAHVTPVGATPEAVDAFGDLLGRRPRRCSSIIGHADEVLALWQRVHRAWGPARQVREDQPLLVTDAPAPVSADPEVRLARPDEIDVVWPAATRMYTEEVGISPTEEDGGRGHHARVANLLRTGRSYVRVAGGRVVFKADLAAVSRHTAQVQGVWVAPGWRHRGIGTAAMAAVVRDTLRRVAPTVSLYVNAHNDAARRVYERCGFHQVGTFATVLF